MFSLVQLPLVQLVASDFRFCRWVAGAGVLTRAPESDASRNPVSWRNRVSVSTTGCSPFGPTPATRRIVEH